MIKGNQAELVTVIEEIHQLRQGITGSAEFLTGHGAAAVKDHKKLCWPMVEGSYFHIRGQQQLNQVVAPLGADGIISCLGEIRADNLFTGRQFDVKIVFGKKTFECKRGRIRNITSSDN